MEVGDREGQGKGAMKEEDSWSNNEDDFGDFEDFEVKDNASSWSAPPSAIQEPPSKAHTISVQDILHSIESKVISVIASNFKEVTLEETQGEKEEEDSSLNECSYPFKDPIWSHLQSSNESLSHFTWSSSKANANLMSSLQIDSRNILYDGKWKSRTLPSFMENTPQLLEPTKVVAKASSSSGKKPEEEEEDEQSVLPVEFDWKDSCLTDPLENNQEDNSSQVTKSEKTANIIDSFPLLNFMQSSTLIFPINGMDPKL